jgi:hypothetical protein
VQALRAVDADVLCHAGSLTEQVVVTVR